MKAAHVLPVLFGCMVLAGCGPRPDTGADDAALKAGEAAEAAQMAREFETHVAAERWDLAKAQGDVLMAKYPDSPESKRIRAQHAEAEAKSEKVQLEARLANLWTYQTQDVGKRQQLSAAIYARDDIETGSGTSQVRLIFRDHPEWGRSSYLVLDNGDFNCYGGCQLKMRVDGKPRSMAGSRPKTDEAIAMFIEDERALWRTVKNARELAIDVPLKAGGTREAVFEVGGLDPERLPGW